MIKMSWMVVIDADADSPDPSWRRSRVYTRNVMVTSVPRVGDSLIFPDPIDVRVTRVAWTASCSEAVCFIGNLEHGDFERNPWLHEQLLAEGFHQAELSD